METTTIRGFLLIKKPKDITSFECIRKLQKIVGYKKGIGHTGTLDPFATGLLIIAFDRQATKHSDAFLKLDKTYVATGKLGELTSTLDYTGEIIATNHKMQITQNDLKEAIARLGSDYLQTPPIYAALKHQGAPLYALAREQRLSHEELTQIAQEKQRCVTIHNLSLLDYQFPSFTLHAHVSHGTYIRSLVNDLAKIAGTYATTYALERIQIGPFKLENAHKLDSFTAKEDIEKALISIEEMLQKLANYQK